jgi:hypothetical protein
MERFPRVNSVAAVAIATSEALVLQDASGREVARLENIVGHVFRLADGSRSVARIARELEDCGIAATEEVVWSALDQLSDLNLLSERVTPPALTRSLSRRGILRVASGVLGATPALASQLSFAQGGEQQSKENSDKAARQRESADKSSRQQESNAKSRAQEEAGKRMQEEVNKSRKR